MSVDIILPKLGFSMTEGTLTEWLAEDGAQISQGQPLFALESDKSTQEVESPASGTLRILKGTGENYPIGEVLGIID